MKIKIFFISCVLALSLLGQQVSAGQLEDAIAAFKRNDDVTAIQLLKPIAQNGDGAAQYLLGAIYWAGQGVPKDYPKALKWFRLSANQGGSVSQFRLGYMYYRGEGVPQDFVLAHMWFNLAAASYPASDIKGRDKAVNSRSLVAQQMTPDQISEAQRLAREWMAAHPKK
jgi:hypothetical protein